MFLITHDARTPRTRLTHVGSPTAVTDRVTITDLHVASVRDAACGHTGRHLAPAQHSRILLPFNQTGYRCGLVVTPVGQPT